MGWASSLLSANLIGGFSFPYFNAVSGFPEACGSEVWVLGIN
jgi:hypothetical protein